MDVDRYEMKNASYYSHFLISALDMGAYIEGLMQKGAECSFHSFEKTGFKV